MAKNKKNTGKSLALFSGLALASVGAFRLFLEAVLPVKEKKANFIEGDQVDSKK